MTAEFKKFKNKNWNAYLINNNDKKRKLIIKSMEGEVMVKIIEGLIRKPEEFKGNKFSKSCKILKEKVEAIKYFKTNH